MSWRDRFRRKHAKATPSEAAEDLRRHLAAGKDGLMGKQRRSADTSAGRPPLNAVRRALDRYGKR